MKNEVKQDFYVNILEIYTPYPLLAYDNYSILLCRTTRYYPLTGQ